MIKRNGTPLSLNNRRKVFDKIPYPRKRKITSDESDKLILPALKDNSMKKSQKMMMYYIIISIQKLKVQSKTEKK